MDISYLSNAKLLLTLFSFLICTSILAQEPSFPQSIIEEGIQIKFNMLHIDTKKKTGEFKEGDDVLFRFAITDTLTNQGVSGAAPAAWMEPLVGEGETPCDDKIAAFIGGSLFKRAELDLNVYYVLTLNNDATISVVDPLFGFGGTQLLALIELENPGMDWAIPDNQLFVFITVPASEKIAVINTSNWKIEKYIPLNAMPNSIEIQADEEYLWVDFQSNKIEDYSGVAVIATRSRTLKATIPTGKGKHHIVISDNNQFAFVSNSLDQTLSVIEVATLKKIKDIPLSEEPASMAWSTKAQTLYLTGKNSGKVTVIDGLKHEKIKEVQGMVGMTQISFEPTGRFGFIVNPQQSYLQILDAATNRIVQTGDMESEPDQVIFSDELAYVRHKNSELILMIPLDQVGKEGTALQAADFPAGQNPPGKCDFPSNAPGMVQAPGANAMLIANPLDKNIYYYKEGMAAPMGNFTNYKRMPRAVEVIDRSLEERSSGVYETVGKIRGFGDYEVAFFVDVPRITHCFKVNVKEDEALELERLEERMGTVSVEFILPSNKLKQKTEIPLLIRVIDPTTKEVVSGLEDIRIRSTSSGNWFYEEAATETKMEGVYNSQIEFPEAGIYYIYVECPSKGLSFNNPQYVVIQAI